MCGRYYIDIENEMMNQLIERIKVKFSDIPLEQMAIGEVYPSQTCLVIVNDKEPKPALMTWGYPKWDQKGIIINARTEGILEKSMFRNDFVHRRCAVVSSGYYEWDKEKSKHYIQGQEDILYVAGVYSRLPESKLPVFAILTKASTGAMQQIHHRSPLLLSRKQLDVWQSDSYQTLLAT